MDTIDNINTDTDVSTIMLQPLPMAYVKPVITDKGKNFAVCDASGTQLALFATQDAAYYAAKQYDLDPKLLH